MELASKEPDATSMKMIIIENCPACGSDCKSVAFQPKEDNWERFRKLSQRKYKGYMDQWQKILDMKILQCDNCKHFWHRTIPDQESLIDMYNNGIPLKGGIPKREPTTQMLKAMKAFHRLISELTNDKPKLLDYGSGLGRWARAAIISGFEVVAYEPSIQRSSKYSNKIDFKIIYDLKALGKEKFHAINLEQVLEHTPAPLEILFGLKKFCYVQTIVRITVPNLERYSKNLWIDFPFNGKQMHILSPYEHLQGFNQSSLEAILKRAGLKQHRNFKILFTHPKHAMMRVLGQWLPFFRNTMALASFSNYDEKEKR